jgi:hypothetical protein
MYAATNKPARVIGIRPRTIPESSGSTTLVLLIDKFFYLFLIVLALMPKHLQTTSSQFNGIVAAYTKHGYKFRLAYSLSKF